LRDEGMDHCGCDHREWDCENNDHFNKPNLQHLEETEQDVVVTAIPV